VDRRFRTGRALAYAVFGTFLWASTAMAAPKDAAATKLADDAINTDYLATNFAEAEKKLRNAAAMCAANACTPQVRARVLRDLGVVLIAGLGRAEDGRKAFVEALEADPDLALEKALTTTEIDRIFRAAKTGGSVPAGKGGGASPAAAAHAGGDMVHTPAAEQLALTPVPIYVELPAGIVAVKVVARYKPYGTSEWKTLELRRLGNGYGAEVPCRDVGSTTGDFVYFVQATDAAGDVVSMSGSRATPNKVPIKNALSGEPPHLPGVAPSSKCADSADCPPGLPGCPTGKAVAKKGWGATCEQETECGEGLWCNNGVCDTGAKADADDVKASGRICDQNGECDPGETCNTRAHVCERSATDKPKRVWLSLNLGQDISLVSSQPDVCGTPEKLPASQYTCIDQDGFGYQGVPQAAGTGNGNAINGGFNLATTRITGGFDYLIADNVTIGARLGYVFGTGPGRTLSHFHGEGRAAFWFGKDPFSRERVRPFLLVAGGIAEVYDKLDVPIVETDLRKGVYDTQTLTVWRRTGGAFAGGGGGVMIPTGAGQGFLAELKIQALFPNVGIAIAPSLVYALRL
jgi:hypothetical protein